MKPKAPKCLTIANRGLPKKIDHRPVEAWGRWTLISRDDKTVTARCGCGSIRSFVATVWDRQVFCSKMCSKCLRSRENKRHSTFFVLSRKKIEVLMKFRRRPQRVEAFQLTEPRFEDKADWPKWLLDAFHKDPGTLGSLYFTHKRKLKVDTLNLIATSGLQEVCADDWIVKLPNESLCVFEPETFKETYELE